MPELKILTIDHLRLVDEADISTVEITERKSDSKPHLARSPNSIPRYDVQPESSTSALEDQQGATDVTTSDSDLSGKMDQPLERLPKDVLPERWNLALEAMRTFPAIRNRRDMVDISSEPSACPFFIEELLVPRAGNWPSDSLLNNFRGMLMGMTLWFASMAFGAVHVAAWNDFFPSKLEGWLWCSGSVYIVGSGLIWMTINFLGQASQRFDRYWDSVMARQASLPSYIIIGSLCSVCGLAYGYARIFLVVESAISLRQLPIEA